MKKNVFKTETAEAWMDQQGIIHVVNFPDAHVELKHAKEHIEITKNFGNKKRPILVDITDIHSVTREAREYFSGDEASKRTKGIAVIVGSPVSRVIGNFLIGLNAPNYPIKLFITEKDALKWLQQFIND